MLHEKARAAGESLVELESNSLKLAKPLKYTIAAAGVSTSNIGDTAGIVILNDSANGDSALIGIINTGATVSAIKIGGSTGITITKDNASTINAYIEGGVLKVQNSTASEVTVEVTGLF